MHSLKALILGMGLVAISMMGQTVQGAEGAGARIELGSNQDSISKILPGFVMHVENAKQLVALERVDGSGMVMMQILKPVPYINTLESYATHVMQYYQGSSLKAQPQRRGYSFTYQDSAPCSGLVTFFDGTSYLMMGVCGKVSQDEVTKALNIAKKQLSLDDLISRTSMPKLYY